MTIADMVAELIARHDPGPTMEEISAVLKLPADGLVDASFLARVLAQGVALQLAHETHAPVVHEAKIQDGVTVGDSNA